MKQAGTFTRRDHQSESTQPHWRIAEKTNPIILDE
jgi:hypothetical protein